MTSNPKDLIPKLAKKNVKNNGRGCGSSVGILLVTLAV